MGYGQQGWQVLYAWEILSKDAVAESDGLVRTSACQKLKWKLPTLNNIRYWALYGLRGTGHEP